MDSRGGGAEMHCGGLLTFQYVARAPPPPIVLVLSPCMPSGDPLQSFKGALQGAEEEASRAVVQVQSNSFCVRR